MGLSRSPLDYLGTAVCAVAALAVAVALVLALALNAAADDMRMQVNIGLGQPLEHPRSPWGTWVAGQLGRGVAADDLVLLRQTSVDLDHRAVRIREMAAAGSVVALLVALLSLGRANNGNAANREEASPLARTSKSGSV